MCRALRPGGFLLACVLGAVLLAGCGEKREVVLAALLPLVIDGQATPDGGDTRRGMQLAVEALNRQGGIRGRAVRLEIRDTRSEPDLARQEYLRLLEEHAPLVTFAAYSHIIQALADEADRHQAPLLAICTASRGATRGHPWVFRYWPDVGAHVRSLKALVLQLRLKDLAVAYVDTIYGRSLFQSLGQALSGNHVQVRGVPMGTGHVDFRKLLAPVSDGQGILIAGMGSHFADAFTALKGEGYPGAILATSGAALPSIMAMPAAQGVYVDTPQIYNVRRPYPREVGRAYAARYDSPFSYFSAIGYEVVMLTAELVRRVEPTPAAFKRGFEEGFVYPGLFGDVSPEPGGHDMGFPLYSAQVEDGNLIYMGQ
ncbi:MAG: ABC transporter substrate-binding protein [Desulfovibrionaceae bacterium]|jgi:branched-chain amino acid transport system substrate-binding protein|nr:ABC transporter substrate-binding protein [Desulfovibrionaceae bacterium]